MKSFLRTLRVLLLICLVVVLVLSWVSLPLTSQLRTTMDTTFHQFWVGPPVEGQAAAPLTLEGLGWLGQLVYRVQLLGIKSMESALLATVLLLALVGVQLLYALTGAVKRRRARRPGQTADAPAAPQQPLAQAAHAPANKPTPAQPAAEVSATQADSVASDAPSASPKAKPALPVDEKVFFFGTTTPLKRSTATVNDWFEGKRIRLVQADASGFHRQGFMSVEAALSRLTLRYQLDPQGYEYRIAFINCRRVMANPEEILYQRMEEVKRDNPTFHIVYQRVFGYSYAGAAGRTYSVVYIYREL